MYNQNIFFTGNATFLAVSIVSIPQLDLESLSTALEWIFLTFLPNFCLAEGLMDYYENYEILLQVCTPTIINSCKFLPNPCCRSKYYNLIVNFSY
jgi:ATP-binding cassette subfamily A (ABC1) protein 3